MTFQGVLTEREPQELAGELPAPRWDRWLLVARLISTGFTQAEAARAAGVGVRTIRRWQNDSRWPQAVAESAMLWHGDAILEARRAIMKKLEEGDASVAQWVAERLDPALRKPEPARAQAAAGLQVVIFGEQYGFEKRPGPQVVELPSESFAELLPPPSTPQP